MSATCGTKKFSLVVCSLSRSIGLLAVLLLGACNSPSRVAPIEQMDQPPGIKLNHHTVSRNDTLYSIAWRYSMDYRELASLNNIAPPYVIRNGQRIRLANDMGGTSRPLQTVTSPDVQVTAVADDSSGVSEVVSASDNTKLNSVDKPVAAVVKQDAEHPVKQNTIAPSTGGGRWIWPANGSVISRFSATDPLRKGIDLDGRLGNPVVAARSGSVVYAGSGLAGYGELVIIKHDEQFLSAYGHNSKLLVKEGETVTSGQKIAEVGSSGTDSNKLHFEIRQEGKPVDPLLYLPKK